MKKEKTFSCWHCGKSFRGYGDRHYCSTSCAHINVNTRGHVQDHICERCGKSFRAPAPSRFCGQTCANRTRAERRQIWSEGVCKQCGKPFLYKPYHHKRAPRQFCSRTCSNLGRDITIGEIAKLHGQKPVTLTCEVCKKPFTILACYLKNRTGRYCSRECFARSRIGKPSPHRPANSNSFGKGGFREDIGQYVRSRWEANYIRYLNHTRHKFVYEPGQFIVELADGSRRAYTPDFLIDDSYYVEIKGWMRADRRQSEVLAAAQKSIGKPLMVIGKSGYTSLESRYADKIPTWEYRGDSFPKPEPKICPNCGKRVTSIHRRTRFCSRKCGAIFRCHPH